MKQKSFNVYTLAPNNELDNEKESNYFTYKEALDDSLKKNNINNIGITGEYGTGKSSIIDTYIKDRNDVLKINFNSLSYVNYKENDKGSNEETGFQTHYNEYKKYLYANIINQIVYQLNYNKTKNTNFKRKVKMSVLTKIIYTLSIINILFLLGYKHFFIL